MMEDNYIWKHLKGEFTRSAATKMVWVLHNGFTGLVAALDAFCTENDYMGLQREIIAVYKSYLRSAIDVLETAYNQQEGI